MSGSLVGSADSADGTVVRAVLAGDTERFRVLVERYRVEFGRYAIALLRDPDAAADAMQEAFIRAYESLAECREPDRFRAWFFRILANRCRTALARRREVTEIGVVDPPARERTDEATLRNELGAALGSALEQLTPEQREAFVMKHVEGYSYEEMAGLLGVGVDALKMRVHRARDALRGLLGAMR